MDSIDLKWIVRKYYEHCYPCEFDNEDKMDKFLERPKLPRLTHRETHNLNRPVSIKEMEFVVKNIPMTEYPGQ